MKQKIYFAPLEGVTDSIFRNTFKKYYGGVDKYFTPFLSPNSTYKFTTREFNQIDPEKNNIETTVPQLLTNDAEHFLWAASEIAALGYREINFNLGCPSGTVVAKKKGSGLLFYPEMLDNMLYQVFNGLESACNKKGCNTPDISIKTRLGKLEADEFYEILDIYNKYPISELTIHPRIQKDFYREPLKPEFFNYAITHSRAPLVFNGDIVSILDIDNTFSKYPDINAIMIGRGLLANPGLVLAYKKGLEEYPLDLKTFKSFHDDLLVQYTELLSGEKPVLHRMKEFIAYWERNFPDDTKIIKKIRKSNSINEYKSNICALFN
ncbi:MAG: tRNA-dihydrouridine synthase family protein [Pseudobutyrivibrio sp.]|nr:tRNA-dihydrouridine synthase family protein [Pseudobutyrivibrio sp.]